MDVILNLGLNMSIIIFIFKIILDLRGRGLGQNQEIIIVLIFKKNRDGLSQPEKFPDSTSVLAMLNMKGY